MLEQIREYNNLYQLMLDSGELVENTRSVSEGCDSRLSAYDVSYEFYNHDPKRHGAIVTPVALSSKLHGPRSRTDDNSVAYYESGKTVTTSAVSASVGTNMTVAEVAVTNNVQGATDTATLENIRANTAGEHSVMLTQSGATVTYTFCIPIMSGVVGTLMPKYLPVGALANDLRIELGIANFGQAFKTVASYDTETDGENFIGTGPGDISLAAANMESTHKFTIKNCELQLEYIEVASDVQQAIEAATGGQYVTSFDSFYHYETTLPQGSAGGTQMIGAKFSSIKTILTTFRDQFGQNRPSYASITSRVNPFSTQSNRLGVGRAHLGFGSKYRDGTGWQYQIGATQYPSKPVTSNEESWMECVKSQHAVAAQSRTGLFGNGSWNVSARADKAGSATPSKWYEMARPSGSFFIAQNLESQSHKSHLAESGVNTLAQTMYLMTRMPSAGKVGTDLLVQRSDDVALQTVGYDGAVTTDTSIIGANITRVPWEQHNVGMQLDHYVHYDAILIISNGICSTRF